MIYEYFHVDFVELGVQLSLSAGSWVGVSCRCMDIPSM
jgi:hypothetical protein